MYYYELHLHTRETSRCAKSSAADMVRTYKEKGFTGICVTDHFVNGYSYANMEGTWDEKIDAFVKGYNAAKAEGDRIGLDVFFGFEYTHGDNSEDYVTLGLTPELVRTRLIDCDKWELDRYLDTVHALGGIVIRAHPYRRADYIPSQPREYPGQAIDAVEVYNGGNALDSYDEEAYQMALREHKPMVAGSDTHHVSTTAVGYIGLDEKPADYAALCAAIKAGKAHVIRRPKYLA